MNRTDDFALEQVPERARVGALRIVLVLMSGGIALPILPEVAMAAAVGALLVSMLSLYLCRYAKRSDARA